MKSRVFFFVGVFAFPMLAEGAPAWLSAPPREDAQYKYYIGRSIPAPNQADAFRASYEDAVESAVKENFGYSLQINKTAYESIDKAALQQKIQEQYQKAEIHGFELRDQYIQENSSGSFEAFTLFRYSKEEIQRERLRLQRASNSAPIKELSELRGSRNDGGATLIVVTIPTKASIEIDGEAFGRTDARIRDLAVGVHKIRLEADNYEPVEEEVRLTPGSEVKLVEHLVLSTGTLSVETSLKNAMITVNGRLVGSAPTAPLKVNAGEEVLIKAEHPEAEPLLQRVTVSRNENRKVSLQLQPKPSFVIVKTNPPVTDLAIEGEKIGHTSPQGSGKFAVIAGERTIEFAKKGFESKSINVSLRGGETKVLEPVELRSLVEIERDAAIAREHARRIQEEEAAEAARKAETEEQHAYEERTQNPWRVLFGLGGGSNNLSNLSTGPNYSCCVVVDATFERRWGALLVTRLGYDYRAGLSNSDTQAGVTGSPNSTKDIVSNSNSHELYLGVYFQIGPFLYLGPELGTATTTLNIDRYSFNGTSNSNGAGLVRGTKTGSRHEKVDQSFRGIRAGFQSKLSEKGIGGYLETSFRHYQDAAPYSGGNKFQITGGLVIGF